MNSVFFSFFFFECMLLLWRIWIVQCIYSTAWYYRECVIVALLDNRSHLLYSRSTALSIYFRAHAHCNRCYYFFCFVGAGQAGDH
jgi:hypothetical protein